MKNLTWRCCTLDCLDPAWDSSCPAGLGLPAACLGLLLCSGLAGLHCTSPGAPGWRLVQFLGSGSLWF